MSFERGEDEIVRYYQKIRQSDLLGIWGTELLMRVSFEKARPFLKQGGGWERETWDKHMLKRDRESIVNEMEDMFQFAVEKSIFHHHQGAVGTVVHYMAWSWLIGDMEIFAYLMDARNYANFGAPMFMAVGQKYEMLDLLPDKESEKTAFLNMANGRRCNDLCISGCKKGSPTFFRPQVIVPKLILPSEVTNDAKPNTLA